jgi:hypothetical protein
MHDMKNRIGDWRVYLLELFVIGLSLCSGLTTFIGARQLVNESYLVALLFTLGIQGSMYVVAHRATLNQFGSRRRAFALYATWLLLALFSVYSSALGMFELQRDSLRKDHDRSALISEWRSAVEEIAAFQSQALTVIRTHQREAELQLTLEKNRETAYRKARRPYPSKEKQIIQARLTLLQSGERKLLESKPLPATTPDDNQQARSMLDDAFLKVADAYAQMPEDCRSESRLPRRSFAATVPEDLQKAFWVEVKSYSGPAFIMLLIAFLLDFLPISIRYACSPRRSMAEKVRSLRLSLCEIRKAMTSPISQNTISFSLVVDDYHELDVEMTLAADGAGPYLDDLSHHFSVVERAVTEIAGEPMRVNLITSSSGSDIDGNVPLLEQLDGNLQIHLLLEPVRAGRMI